MSLPVPCPPHPMCCELLVLLLGAEEVTKDGGSGGSRWRKEVEERGEVQCRAPATAKEPAAACRDKKDKQQHGGHRAGAATSGKGLQSRGTSGAGSTNALTGAPRRQALPSSILQFFAFEWRRT